MSAHGDRLATGVPGLDEILNGGLPRGHVYLVQGRPGTGKTTLGLQFLIEGVRRGERAAYITLLHSPEELREMAASHGWDLDGVAVVSLAGEAQSDSRRVAQTLLPSGEVQLEDVREAIRDAVDRIRPDRLVFDSIDQIRLLASDQVVFRLAVLALLGVLNDRQVTALFIDPGIDEIEFLTLAHGAITLDSVVPTFGEIRRRLRVEKLRGSPFAGGYHAMSIRRGGAEVYPRLPLAPAHAAPEWRQAPSGITALDTLVGGGLEYGTSALFIGQTGTGKSTLVTAYVHAAASAGNHAMLFLFDEGEKTLLRRSAGLGMDLEPLIAAGRLTIRPVRIGELSPGEMAHRMRLAVEQRAAKVVAIDSLSGYLASSPDEPHQLGQLHEMMVYLAQQGVLSLLTMTEHGMVVSQEAAANVSYMADTVLLLRHFEAGGVVRLAVSVLKKRHGDHERTIRELGISAGGILVGDTLTDCQGVLSGEPRYLGARDRLME